MLNEVKSFPLELVNHDFWREHGTSSFYDGRKEKSTRWRTGENRVSSVFPLNARARVCVTTSGPELPLFPETLSLML